MNNLVLPNNNMNLTESFGERQLATQNNTAAIAAAEQAKAAVQARYIMALQRPRNWDAVEAQILKECNRKRFAEMAKYRLPYGKGVTGFTIRFAEVVARHMGNILVESTTTYDDDEKRKITVTVTDLESNTTWPKDIMISKTVERRHPKDSEHIISKRINSRGEEVFTVRASEGDLMKKEGALISKAARTLIFRLLPGYIMDAAEERVKETLRAAIRKDPKEARIKMIEAFDSMGISVQEIEDHLGCKSSQIQPHDIEELRDIYAAMKDGAARWSDYVEQKNSIPDSAKTVDPQSLLSDMKPAADQADDGPRSKEDPPQESITIRYNKGLKKLAEAFGEELRDAQLNLLMAGPSVKLKPQDKQAIIDFYNQNRAENGHPLDPELLPEMRERLDITDDDTLRDWIMMWNALAPEKQ